SAAVASQPSAVTLTSATGITTTAFTANWQTTNGNATSYRLDVSTSATFDSLLPGYNNASVNGLTLNITALQPGIQYYYRVRAVTASGTSANAASSLKTITSVPVAKAGSSLTT